MGNNFLDTVGRNTAYFVNKKSPNGIWEESILSWCPDVFFCLWSSCQSPDYNSSKGRREGRRGGLMVSALDSGASGPGSSPGRGQCVVFLGKTFYSHSASLHPGV